MRRNIESNNTQWWTELAVYKLALCAKGGAVLWPGSIASNFDDVTLLGSNDKIFAKPFGYFGEEIAIPRQGSQILSNIEEIRTISSSE